jgi:hypothetical protein
MLRNGGCMCREKYVETRTIDISYEMQRSKKYRRRVEMASRRRCCRRRISSMGHYNQPTSTFSKIDQTRIIPNQCKLSVFID